MQIRPLLESIRRKVCGHRDDARTTLSPCWLWTDKARKEPGISKDPKFTAWCCAYFAVRKIIKGDPKNINEKLTSLQKLGTESKPSNMKGGRSDLASSI
jgi:hypothetical protein